MHAYNTNMYGTRMNFNITEIVRQMDDRWAASDAALL